jgi:uncharacterized membrane protein YqjE
LEDFMARTDIRGANGVGPALRHDTDASIRDLLRQLADDGSSLVRSEIDLAKVELKESGRHFALDGIKIVAAASIAWIGLLAVIAAAIIGLGVALDGMYWLSALIVGALFLVIGGVLAKLGIDGMKKNSVAPESTMRSIKRDREMVKREFREMRDGLRS